MSTSNTQKQAAVIEAYGFPKDATESDIVARLFKMYQNLTKIAIPCPLHHNAPG